MNRSRAAIVGILLAASASACVTDVALLGPDGEGAGGKSSYFLELFADDPLRRTADLEHGVYGDVLQDGAIRNANSELDFGHYHEGEFTVGVQGSDRGFIVDLGEDEALGAALPTGGGSGFGALTLTGSTFGYALADTVFDDGTADHAPVVQAHVYVIRLSRDGSADLVWKALAADLSSPTRVALHWIRVR